MRDYELLYLLTPGLDEEQVEAFLSRISDAITDQGGSVGEIDRWGKRRLAYEVNGHRDGYYTVVRFHAGTETSHEVERLLRLSDDVLRHVVVRLDESGKPVA